MADIAEALGLDCALTVRVVDELREDGQLRGVEVAQDPYLLRIEPTAKARLELGEWPTRGDELYDRFIAVLTERIAAEPDEAKRTRLEKLLGVADDEGHQRAGSPSSHVCLPGRGYLDYGRSVSVTGGSDMHVRTARPSDAAAMGALVVRAWQAAYRGLMPDDYLDGLTVHDRTDQWTRILTGELDPPRAVFVAEDEDGRVVGFVAVGGEMDVPDAMRGQVYALNVDPDRWGRGVGRALLAAGCGHLRGVGFATAVLWVHRDNARACRFYRAAGWRADGTERRADALGVEVPEVRFHHSLIG